MPQVQAMEKVVPVHQSVVQQVVRQRPRVMLLQAEVQEDVRPVPQVMVPQAVVQEVVRPVPLFQLLSRPNHSSIELKSRWVGFTAKLTLRLSSCKT